METGSQEFIQMVVEDLEGHFADEHNPIISMNNPGSSMLTRHTQSLRAAAHSAAQSIVYSQGPNGIIMDEDELADSRIKGEENYLENEEVITGDITHNVRIGEAQGGLIISNNTGMLVQSGSSLTGVSQPGFIAMKPGATTQCVGLSDIVYGQHSMGHIILQGDMDNEMIVEENVEVGDDSQSGGDAPHGEIILVPNMLKQEIIESGEVIVGSNIHGQNIDNEIIIPSDHLSSGRHASDLSLADLEDDDGGFGDSNLIIDTSIKEDNGLGQTFRFECGLCGASTKSRGALKKHAAKHHSDRPSRIEEQEEDDGTRIYKCPSCDYTNVRRDKLDKHMSKHVAEGYSPSGKKRSKTTPPQRLRHAAEEYKCIFCSYRCVVEKSFKKHMKLHQTGMKEIVVKISCKICGKDRASEAELRKHMKKHKDGADFVCDVCGFSSVQLKKIIQHRRMHTGEKPHLCPHCAYRSARRDNLRSHVRRMHKKENMYIDTFNPRAEAQPADD